MGKEKTYSEKLKDDRWLKKRREILERDEYTCQSCADRERVMHVHHEFYFDNCEPWDYPNSALVTLCDSCHTVEEHNRKSVYKNFNMAVADAGFTREDIEKLTEAFRLIRVRPIFSYLLTSGIYRGITDAWYKFDEKNPVYSDDADGEEVIIKGSGGIKSMEELSNEFCRNLERKAYG